MNDRVLYVVGGAVVAGFLLLWAIRPGSIPWPQSDDHIKHLIRDNVSVRCWQLEADGGLP